MAQITVHIHEDETRAEILSKTLSYQFSLQLTNPLGSST